MQRKTKIPHSLNNSKILKKNHRIMKSSLLVNIGFMLFLNVKVSNISDQK